MFCAAHSELECLKIGFNQPIYVKKIASKLSLHNIYFPLCDPHIQNDVLGTIFENLAHCDG